MKKDSENNNSSNDSDDKSLISNKVLHKLNRYVYLHQSKIKQDKEMYLMGEELIRDFRTSIEPA